jgi:FkbM family methyltransferase
MIKSDQTADELRRIRDQARSLESDARSSPGDSGAAPIVLFGLGPLGVMTLAHLHRVGATPVALVDSDPRRWGSLIEGIRISSPQEAVERYADSARFVVTIYNGGQVRRQLQQMGCRRVSHFADLYFEFAAEFLPYCGIAARAVVLDAWSDVGKAAEVWHDDRSRTEFLAQLAWRLRLPAFEMPAPDPAAQCYFPEDLFRYLKNEVLIDCGAFDGDSVRQYLGRCPATRDVKIIALEPDSGSFQRLARWALDLPRPLAGNVRIEPWAVADKSGDVAFEALGSVRSGVQDRGGTQVTAVALDDIGVDPTFIKMDIEGLELRALQGASRTLSRCLPVLAISLYHHAADLWSIPNFLKSLVPEYRLFLRRYAEDCWELVLYAVPASRLTGNPKPCKP